jgi:hypothetical protein
MLFKQEFFPGLADGSITLAFRRWAQPRVRAGSYLKSPVGLLHIDAIEKIEAGQIDEGAARRAGHASLADLWEELNAYEGDLYRIAFHYAGPDPRLALRNEDALSPAEFEELKRRLARYESKLAWTTRALRLIRDHEGLRSGDLAPRVLMRQRDLKRRIRQLKELGLTESLGIGYRLSPRGRAYLNMLEGEADATDK